MLSYTAEDAFVDAQDDQRFAFVQFRALAMRMNDLRGAPVAFEIPPGTAEHAYSATGAITGHHISEAAAKLSRDASIVLDPAQMERLSLLQAKGSPLSDADSAMKRSIDEALAKGLNAYLDAGAATLAVSSGKAPSFSAFSKLSGTLGAAFSTPLTVLAASKAARKAAAGAAVDGAPESAPAPVSGASASAAPDGARVKSAEDLRQEAWLNGLVYDKPIPEGLASASARAVGEGVPAPLRRQMIRASAGLALGGEKVIELKKNMSKRRRRGAKAVGHVGEAFLGLSAFEHAWSEVHERREKEKKELEEASKSEKRHVLDELKAEGMVGPSFAEPNKSVDAPDAAGPSAEASAKLIDSLALSGLSIAEKISDLAAAHDIISAKAPQEPPAGGLLSDDGAAPVLDLRKFRG